MKRIKKLIADWRRCRELRKEEHIKWRIEYENEDIPACSFFFIPTIVYNTYPYSRYGEFVFNVYFLHWYIGIGERCKKETSDENH